MHFLPFEQKLIGTHVFGWLTFGPLQAYQFNFTQYFLGDAAHNFILHFKDVINAAVKPFAPQNFVGVGFNQRHGHPDLIARGPHRALNHVINFELLDEVIQIIITAGKIHTGLAGHDRQLPHHGQFG